MRVLPGHDEEVARWVSQHLGKPILAPYAAMGVLDDDGVLRGAAVFNDYQGPGGNIEFTYYGPETLTRSVIRWLANYAFVTNKASRVTFKTHRSNHLVRKLLNKHGMVFEGVLRRYYNTDKGSDALVFMLDRRNAARWLRGIW